MGEPDEISQTIERCRDTLRRIKHPEIRKEYALFFRSKIHDLRERKPAWTYAADMLRAPSPGKEQKWVDAVRSPLGKEISAAVIEIDGQIFAVVPILHTFIDIVTDPNEP